MPSKKIHILSAFILAFVLILLFSLLSGVNITETNELFALMTIIGTIVPDLIEPARNYRHRKIFHSKLMLKILVIVFFITIILGLIGLYFMYFASAFIAGYILHLILDSLTKMGLP
jgi:inner membrane protein